MRTVEVFAPASIANLAVGFDTLGLAVTGLGDRCRARVVDRGDGARAQVTRVTGDPGTEPWPDADEHNTAAIAAGAVLDLARLDASRAVELHLHKGLPVGSGLGSSAASAVAAAQATNLAIGNPLRPEQVLQCCLEAEAAVAGRHADNIAASLLGGLVLVRGLDPIDVVRLPIPDGLVIVVLRPRLRVLTGEARGVIPATLPTPDAIAHAANLGSFVAACYSGDLDLLARCVVDPIAEPVRLASIDGAAEVLDAMRAAGALAASLSGSGPALFAMCRGAESAREVAGAGVAAWAARGVETTHLVQPADGPGAREV